MKKNLKPYVLKIMNAVVLGSVLQMIFLGVLIASESEAQKIQSVREVKIDVHLKNASLEECFKAVEKKSDFQFTYDKKLLKSDIRINYVSNNASISDLLLELSKEASVKFKQVNNTINVQKYSRQLNSEKPLEIIIQSISITGKVTDETQESLPGVNVIVKGTSNGTVTDIEGNYSLEIPDTESILVFSSVGYVDEEIVVGNRTIIDLSMTPNITALEELVVVGYGTQKKRDLTGSMTGMKEEQFNPGIVVAPEQLMQGKLSGVNIVLNSGEPGANSTVRIRGGTSISAGNDPLYVIDGVPVAFAAGDFQRDGDDRMSTSANNPLNMLNPGDIESIDVLKDASAAAIYGSRGANGVILITTKKGKSGKGSLEYNAYFGLSSVRKKLDVLSADQYRNYLDANSETIGVYLDGGTSTDWQDEIFRTAFTQSHDLALSGGSENTTYRASLNYLNQEGVIVSSSLEKLATRINITHKAINDRLKINLNLGNAFFNNDNAPNTNNSPGDFTGGIIRDALRFNPTFPVKDENGDYTFISIFNQNPIEQADLIEDDTRTFRSLGNVLAEFKITDWLKINTNIAYTYEDMNRGYYAPRASRIGNDIGGGVASQESRNSTSKLIETNLIFNKNLGDKHDLTVLGGYSWQDFVYTQSYLRANDFVTDLTGYDNLDGAIFFNPPQTGRQSNTLISYFARVNYGYANKYLLTLSVRQDGSSRFGDNEKWGTFPSAAFAWRLIEENFMNESNLFSDLKLRLGYGVTGNQEIGNYISVPTLSAGSNKYIIGGQIVTAVGPDQLSNPNLKWEETTQTNIGIDFGLFGHRLSGSIDYYIKRTSDLLLSFAVPSPAEVSFTTANVGEVQNIGYEIELNGVLVESSNLNLDLYANFTQNKNEVISLSNEIYNTEQILHGRVGAPGFSGMTTEIIVPGQPLGTFFGFEYIGVDADGIQQFTDVNGDGMITPGEDRKVIGNTQPDFFYGIGTRGTFKKFSFDLFFRGIHGVDVLNSTAIDLQDISKLPGFNVTETAINDVLAFGQPAIYSSKWIQDASFFRLENVTIGYSFDVNNINWLNYLNLYVTGQNLFVLTDYIGYDPEVIGRDMTIYPRPRSVMLGLNVKF